MAWLGVDIGTGSSKGVLVTDNGTTVATAVVPHRTATPQPGWFEHDPETCWWGDTRRLVADLLSQSSEPVDGVAISGIGPVALVTDAQNRPLRPAILYGIDTRSAPQAGRMNARFGKELLIAKVGNDLTTQSVAPKLAWIAEKEPDTWAATRRIYSAPGWVVRRVTGEYTMDHYSASVSDPLYDLHAQTWWEDAWVGLEHIERPRLAWPGEVVGYVTNEAASLTGLPSGIPVVAGTIDAAAEGHSAHIDAVGDCMVMYGSTFFFIQTVADPILHPGLWAAVGLQPGLYASAAGMATSGLVTQWWSDVTRDDFTQLTREAAEVAPGSEGLLTLPYFAGERTPIFDPRATGAIVGLRLHHGRGHVYRSILEGVAHGVRHNLETMAKAGSAPRRLVAVGGGTTGDLWTRIVSDVTGLPQDLPTVTVGASYGDARFVASSQGVDTSGWNPVSRRIEPDPSVGSLYDQLHEQYLAAYAATAPIMHSLADITVDR